MSYGDYRPTFRPSDAVDLSKASDDEIFKQWELMGKLVESGLSSEKLRYAIFEEQEKYRGKPLEAIIDRQLEQIKKAREEKIQQTDAV